MASNSKILDDDKLAKLNQLSEQMHKYCWNLKKHLGNSKSQLLKSNAVANEFKSKYSEGANTIKNLETILRKLFTSVSGCFLS